SLQCGYNSAGVLGSRRGAGQVNAQAVARRRDVQSRHQATGVLDGIGEFAHRRTPGGDFDADGDRIRNARRAHRPIVWCGLFGRRRDGRVGAPPCPARCSAEGPGPELNSTRFIRARTLDSCCTCTEFFMPRNHPSRRPTNGSSSTGRAPVSKTGGWGFESLLPCEEHQLSDHYSVIKHEPEDDVSQQNSPPKKRTSPVMFYRQVVAELRKVVWPDRPTVVNYFIVVAIFVVIMMAIV